MGSTMHPTDTVVQLSLPRNFAGQILEGLAVLTEQWDATAAYLGHGEIGDQVIRECSNAEEAEGIAEFYRQIANDIRGQLPAKQGLA